MSMRFAAVMIGCSLVLASCSHATSGDASGNSISTDADRVDVTVMDTGGYPTVSSDSAEGLTWGKLGDYGEALRMAEYVIGPWQVDSQLRAWGPLSTTRQHGALTMGSGRPVLLDMALTADPELERRYGPALNGSTLADIAVAHGYLTGFESTRERVRTADTDPGLILANAVLRFPDAESARAAAAEMVESRLGIPLKVERIPIGDDLEAIRFADNIGKKSYLEIFTPHNSYLLYQRAVVTAKNMSRSNDDVVRLAGRVATDQRRLINQFSPNLPVKFADIPMDPSGDLLSVTLNYPDRVPFPGAFSPDGWLHLEDDPVATKPLFKEAGVEWVFQMLATVYQARDSDGAGKLVDGFSAVMDRMPDVRRVDSVIGLPGARCFERTKGVAPAGDPAEQRVAWRFKCIAQAGRYAFTTFSDTERDVKQQISAQYRILAGE